MTIHTETLVDMDTWFLNDRLHVLLPKSIAESIAESMAYFWSSFIGIGIANNFFMKYMYWYGLCFLKVLLTTLASSSSIHELRITSATC